MGRVLGFPQKLYDFATGKRFNIFPKFVLQWVGVHEESSQVHGRCSVGITKGVVGSRDQNLKLEYLENGKR